jgi:uncharacterized protein (DUF2236 family)
VVSRKVHAEVALLLGWSSAILLQLAHPLVARGVADHSSFRHDARAPWRRLHATLGAMLALTFGDEEEARAALDRINAVHDRVHGVLPESAGRFGAGTPYSAHDPALLRWVHATCVEQFLGTYERFVAPLTVEERDRYCEEAAHVETALGMPAGYLPRSMHELHAYMASMYGSGEIAVSDTARELAAALLAPPLSSLVWPVTWWARVAAVGLLPDHVRDAYGFRWGARHRAALAALSWSLRRVVPRLPRALRHWPAARRRESAVI